MSAPERVTIKLEIELEIDPEAYWNTYGVQVADLPEDVRSYAVELFTGCAAALEECWELRQARGRRGRPARRVQLGGVQ